jgi:hypothetical protein
LHADEWFAEALAERRAAGQQLGGSQPPGQRRSIGRLFYEDAADEMPAEERIPDSERRQVWLPDRTLFTNIETHVFRFSRYMPVTDIVDMLGTYSGVITASPELRDIGRARAAAALAEQFPGAAELEMPMRSRCWRAGRLGRTTR